jgi:hypothetical protein
MVIFLDSRSQAVTPTVGFKPVVRQLPDAKLKPKIQGDCYAWTAGYLFSCGFEQFKYLDLNYPMIPPVNAEGSASRSNSCNDQLPFCSNNRANSSVARPF